MSDGNSPNPSTQNPTITPDDQPASVDSPQPPSVGGNPQATETPVTTAAASSPSTPPESVVTTEGSKGGNESKSKKIVATILGIAILIAAVGAGVFLVGQQQVIRIGAWDCQNYVFDIGNDGLVTVQNGSTRDEPAQQARVFINGNLVATLDVPALDAGNAATLGTVDVGDVCSFSWEVIGTKDCSDKGGHDRNPTLNLDQFSFTWTGPPQLSHATTTFCDGSTTGKVNYSEPGSSTTVTFDKAIQSVDGKGGTCDKSASQTCTAPTPTEGPTPTPTQPPTPTLTPTPPPIGASCLNVQAYDTNWNLLSGFDLSDLETGDTVRFAVAGTTTSGGFDKARFTINGTLRPEVVAQKPASDEYYDEYTVPEGVTDFTVSAEIHHTSLGWF